MECDICGVGRPRRSKFHCPACARATLYSLRLEHARVLLEKGKLGKDVESKTTSKEQAPAVKAMAFVGQGDNAAYRKIKREEDLAEIRSSRSRVETIHQKGEELRKQMSGYRDELAARKAKLSTRQDELKAAHAEFDSSRPIALDHVRKAVQRSDRRLARVTEDLCHARSWLCHAAASISSVRRVASSSSTAPHTSASQRTQGGQASIQEQYEVSGLSIPHLQDLNNIPLDQLNAVLSHMLFLLRLTCTYLGIRLPAEILPPSANAPMPSIRPPDSSYPLPEDRTSQSLSSSGNSRTTSRLSASPAEATKSKPRSRPLCIPQTFATSAKKLSALAKDDSKHFNLLIEGVAYLAWDIGWLCRSQGVDIGDSWESICDIGRNLHALVIVAAGEGQKRASSQGKRASDQRSKDAKPTFGLRSHNTSAARLPSTADPDPGKGTLLSPQQIRLALRQHLLNDMQGAEWELLEEDDYGGSTKAAGSGDVVLVGKGKRRAAAPLGGEGGEVVGKDGEEGLGLDDNDSGRGEEGEEEILARTAYAEGSEREEVRRGNGWMKVKARR